jgi:ketosteroid isomerase-like protein
MSQENVEIARRAYALVSDLSAFRGGNQDDSYLDYLHPDCELVPPPIYPDTEPSYVGLDGWRRWLGLIDEVFDDWGFEPEQFFDAGDNVVVFVQTSGIAKQSGAEVTIPAAHVLTLRDARIARVEVFLDRKQALEAAGLSG